MENEDKFVEVKINREEVYEKYRKSNETDLFGLVKTENDKIKIVMGECIVSENEFNTFEDADKYIKEKPYELFYNIIMVCLYYEKKMQQNARNDKESAKNNQKD